jgi:hypothetical protein
MQLAFQCPRCAAPFQVAAAHQGQAVACPHCGGAVAIPAATSPTSWPGEARESLAGDSKRTVGQRAAYHVHVVSADREPPPVRGAPAGRDSPPTAEAPPIAFAERTRKVVKFEGEAYEVRSLSSQERAAFRRRVNLVVFILTAAALAVAVLGLLWWRG